jgi:hypothetical protein
MVSQYNQRTDQLSTHDKCHQQHQIMNYLETLLYITNTQSQSNTIVAASIIPTSKRYVIQAKNNVLRNDMFLTDPTSPIESNHRVEASAHMDSFIAPKPLL